MFELADRLVGIYKTYNCTKSVTINPGMYDNVPAPAPVLSSSQAAEPTLSVKAEPQQHVISSQATWISPICSHTSGSYMLYLII